MRAAYISISLLLLAYVVTCAIVVPFTVDEAWTYEEFVKGDFWNVVTYAHPVPNNHILNSLLVKPFAAVSTHEFSLRFPNLLAFVLYLYATYRISMFLFTDRFLSISLFTALMLNTMLIHFFALCRGYGIGISLMLFSISVLLPLTKNFSVRSAHLCLLAGLLSLYASFTLMYAFLAVCLFVFYISYRQKPRNLTNALKAIGIPLLYIVVAIVLCAYPIRQAIRWDMLTYGGTNNFFEDTLYTFLIDVLNGFASQHKTLVIVATSALLAIVFIAAIYKVFSGKTKDISHFAAPFVLFFCILFINLQFYILDSRFVIYRTAMYLYPLIILSIFSAIAMYSGRHRNLVRIPAFGITAVLLYFFIIQIHFTSIHEWRFDAHNKKVLVYITNQQTKGKKIRLFVYHLTSNSFNYYINRLYNDVIDPVESIADINKADLNNYEFIYLRKEDDISAYKNFKIVQSYDDGNYLLYARQNPQ